MNKRTGYNVPATLNALEGYIHAQVEESLHLEYKSADALGKTDGKKKEIAKDVSAMANAAGGVIIYGVCEYNDPDKRHLPEKLDPIDRTVHSKEWLEQVINSNISPKIQGLEIHVIPGREDGKGIYVVEIPQSNTAHQASDKRYYKRYNFESVAMDDYEIRDILNRAKHPEVVLEFEITTETYDIKRNYNLGSFIGDPYVPAYRTIVLLHLRPVNIGEVFAKYVNFLVTIPIDILNDKKRNSLKAWNKDAYLYRGDNTYRDIVDYKLDSPRYGPSRYEPILPHLSGVVSKIKLKAVPEDDERELRWTVHADNAEPREGVVKISDIPVRDISKDHVAGDEEE